MGSSSYHRMVESSTCESQASGEILRLQIGKVCQHLLGRKAASEQIKNVRHPDPHAPDAWPAAALLRIGRDALR